MPEELFEHTTGQGKQENDSDEEIEALKFSEKMMDDKIDKDAIDAKAAKTLICPTLEITGVAVLAPIK